MKSRLVLFLFLFATLLGSTGLATFTGHIQVANATYVKGDVTQDTTWTLVDSPFVIYNNVTVFPNATLTIEPGVEVRFGGPFFIIVHGKLSADGTSKNITLTSNGEIPLTGDWNGLLFDGTQQSLLANCLLKYAQNGITTTNGNVRIENSTIELCENGINATNSIVTIGNSILSDNRLNGVEIAGNGQVNLQQDTIIGNGNGILIAGNVTSGINISQDKIAANNQGISIESTTQSNVTIVANTISSNNYGFYVSSPTTTTITYNSVSFNNAGFYYNYNGSAFQIVKNNDIFGNTIGINIKAYSTGTIDAEQNYWGARNGPYHPLLNPSGEGNPIGGNGVNILFIFFLTAPISHVNTPPTAILQTDKSTVSVNQEVMFFATNSFDEGAVDWYKFDFGDNQTSGWTTLSIFTHKFSSPGIFQAKVTVMDDFGATNQSTLNINVQTGLSPLQVAMNVNSSSPNIIEGGHVALTIFASDSVGPVGSATITLFTTNGGQFTQTTGLTNSSGYFTTVYTASGTTKPSNIRVIARASKTTYADGSSYVYLQGYPLLTIQTSSIPSIVSTESAEIMINVTSNGDSINNATVNIYTDFGTLSTEVGKTDANGILSINYTSPETTISSEATITVKAEKHGYADGVGQATLQVEPRRLVASMYLLPTTVYSGDTANVTVHVKYAQTPVEGANVTASAVLGNFTKNNGLTNSQGNIGLSFIAPLVNQDTNITVTALASSAGYADCQNQTTVTVLPKTFSIKITPASSILNSLEGMQVRIDVTGKQNALPVQGAKVVISANYGSFSIENGTTDSDGSLTFLYEAPETVNSKMINITAIVTRQGFANGANQTSISVNAMSSSGGGWSIFTLLLIIIPVAIAIVLVVLVKMKIIRFSVVEAEK